jgi:medium-chain acyl-[acyl-carrier-protein] hydrolase
LLTELGALADAAVEGLRPLVEGPFAFFGHSMGAVLAFEIARRLEKQIGVSPGILLLAGTRAPHFRVEGAHIYDLPDPEFCAELRKINGTPPVILNDPDAMKFLMPILRADFQAVETYQVESGPQLKCPISVFGGREDQEVTATHLDAWKDYTIGPFARIMIEGTHFFVNESRDQLIQQVDRMIRQYFHV